MSRWLQGLLEQILAKRSYRRNLWWLQIIHTLIMTNLLVSVLVALYENVGITSAAAVLTLSFVNAGSSWAIEVPTGWFADRYGRKLSMLIGIVSYSIGDVMYMFQTKPTIYLGVIFIGVGSAFILGADTALAAASADAAEGDEEERKDLYRTYERRGAGYEGVSEAVGALIAGSLLALDSLWLIPWASLATEVLMLPCLLMVTTPPQKHGPNKKSVWQVLSAVRQDRDVFWALHFQTAISGLTFFVVWLTPLYYGALYGTQVGFSWWWAGYTVSLMAYVWTVEYFRKRFSLLAIMVCLLVAGTTAYILLGVSVSLAGLAGIFLLYGVRAFQKSLWKPYFILLIEEEAVRATVSSLQRTMLWTYYFVVGLPLMVFIPMPLLWRFGSIGVVALAYCAWSLIRSIPRLKVEAAKANANLATEHA